MARINQKDKELLAAGLTIDLNSPNFNYIGGPFLSNQNDYIEALIHDSNANFLESSIVNPDDYLPKNDLNAWNKYKEYNFLYNKMFIANLENLKYAPMPIEPDNYPVVSKPIINLGLY